jgi:hypothetical protein
MPTQAGTPLATAPGGPLNQFDWLSLGGNEAAGVQQSALMRGMPAPFSPWQGRAIYGPRTTPQPVPLYLTSRPYSRGADAHAPKFGLVNYNPIGGGIYSPYKLPVMAGPGARYTFGAIWFDVQAISTSMIMNPTIPIETVNALIATSSVGPSYLTTG